MRIFVPNSTKSDIVKKMINEALEILESVGIPLTTKTERGLERMAVAFLAVAGVRTDWSKASDSTRLKTRDIITVANKHFEENISSGSYDDIRRKDLKLLVIADLIINSGDKPAAATNDPTRGYSLHPDFRELIVHFGKRTWSRKLKSFNTNKLPLSEILARKRRLERLGVTLPGGKEVQLSLGEHNVLQKAIVDEFLPRFGSDCEVLYIGDTADKFLHRDELSLHRLGFFKLLHEELPDIIAYSKKNNWLYLIEAVHSSGPMSEIRVHELKKMLNKCRADLIFVTAFLTRAEFRKWTMEIAWESEVWIADQPDHLIHFNGHKFLGAYSPH